MGGRDELEALRRRAYGPGADIDGDADAINRLRSLENAASPPVRSVGTEQTEFALPSDPETSFDVGEPGPPRARVVLEALARVQRSTWLLIAGSVALAAVLFTVLVVVQRVQTDPLRVGATQVARLSPDADFEVPELFFGGGPNETTPVGFQDFNGLRTVLTSRAFFNVGEGDGCLSVYSQQNVQISANGFSGQVFSACGAGAFPAAVQFGADVDGFPDQLKTAFPEAAAFQFVYDAKLNEVVVFADNG